MPLYRYKAIDPSGRSLLGRGEAANLLDLEQRLTRLRLDLVSGAPAAETLGGWRRSRVRRRDVIHFCFHLEQLASAGVPLIEGLADLRDSIENPRLRQIVAALIESIEGGSNLSQALAEHPEAFDEVFVSLVRTGEHSGKLPEILRRLAEQLKWEDELAAQTRKLLIYPAFVAATVALVTVFLMIYLVPQMTGFLRNAGQEVPLLTRALLGVSAFLSAYWWLVIAVPLLAWLAVRAAVRADPGLAYTLDRVLIGLPLTGPILVRVLLSRFASSFALMYAAGIMVLDALRLSEPIIANRALQGALRSAGLQVAEGKSLAVAFAETGLFPPLVLRMLRVGEATGALDTALLNVSYFYNREVREAIGRMQALIEPALTVVLGAILGWVMLAVLGPVYDAISKVKLW